MLHRLVRHMRRHAIAYVALFIALTGTAVAAQHYIITSTNQIKPSVLKELRGKQGPRGLRGTQGPQGVQGLQGKTGGFSAANVTGAVGPTVTLCGASAGACAVGSSDARCPGLGVALSGGWDGETKPPVSATVAYNEPDTDGHGWHVITVNDASATLTTFHAIAECAVQAPPARDAAGGATPDAARARIHRELASARTSVRGS